MLPINLLAVLVGALAVFIIGFLMHGPVLGKLWMKLANVHPTGNEKLSDMIPQMAKNLLANIVAAYAFAVVYSFAKTSTYISGLGSFGGVVVAIWIWLGFTVAGSSIEVIWMGRSPKLWLFECFSSLLAFSAMGAIIGNW